MSKGVESGKRVYQLLLPLAGRTPPFLTSWVVDSGRPCARVGFQVGSLCRPVNGSLRHNVHCTTTQQTYLDTQIYTQIDRKVKLCHAIQVVSSFFCLAQHVNSKTPRQNSSWWVENIVVCALLGNRDICDQTPFLWIQKTYYHHHATSCTTIYLISYSEYTIVFFPLLRGNSRCCWICKMLCII